MLNQIWSLNPLNYGSVGTLFAGFVEKNIIYILSASVKSSVQFVTRVTFISCFLITIIG